MKGLSSDQRRFREITEKAFQLQVTGLAQLLGWHWLHVSHSPQVNKGVVSRYTTPTHGTLGKGWPDLVLINEKDKRLLFVELKSELGKVSDEQERVLSILRSLDWHHNGVAPTMDGVSVEVYLWRPSDIETIERILA